MSKDFGKPSTYLFAFMNGSYKKVTFQSYDHKEWIIMEKENGAKVFVNSSNLKWIEEIKD